MTTKEARAVTLAFFHHICLPKLREKDVVDQSRVRRSERSEPMGVEEDKLTS
jgi:hypothetical protein